MEFREVKDSGKREEFDTGSVRDTREGKGRFDLIPPVVLKRLAKHYENGARKYGDRNWEKGQPLSRYYDSAFRHLMAWMEGKDDEDHITAVLWNVAAIIHHEETMPLNQVIIDAGPLVKRKLYEEMTANFEKALRDFRPEPNDFLEPIGEELESDYLKELSEKF